MSRNRYAYRTYTQDEGYTIRSMFKLIIFDYDGLMVNSEQVTYGALKTLLARYNHTLAWEYYVRHIGTPVRDALQNFYRDYPMNVSFEKFVKERNSIVSEYVTNKLRLVFINSTLRTTFKQ